MSRGKPLERGTTPLSQGKPLQRRTPLAQTKPLERGKPLSPGKPLSQGKPLERSAPPSGTTAPRPRETKQQLRPVSKKRQAIMPERRTLVRAILAVQPQCVKPGCYADSQDGHERKTRARGGSILSPTNVIGTCRHHNGELTMEPAWGYETGMLLHSWDETDHTEPCPVLTPPQRAAVLKMRDEGWRPKDRVEVEEFYSQWLTEQIERGAA